MDGGLGGGRKKLVLGLDAGCAACGDLARRIEEHAGDRLEVRSLYDPQVKRWRELALGEDTPWVPTLIEVKGVEIRAWTGIRMSLTLTHAVGPKIAWKILQTIFYTKSMDSADASAGTYPDAGLSRAQFMKHLGIGAIAASLAASGLGRLSSRALAKDATKASASAVVVSTVGQERFNQAIQSLSRYLRVKSNGTLQVSEARVADAIKAGRQQGIPPKVFQDLTTALQQANRQILKGELPGGPQLISSGVPAVSEKELRSKDLESLDLSSRATCRGRSGSRFYWWGVRIYLNSCQAANLVYLCSIGASGASLCKRIGPIPCRIAAALLSISCAYYARAASRGTGIVIDKSWGLKLPRVYAQRP